MNVSHKYIFVTGGVVSGLGKGVTAASIGLILKSAGQSVDIVKLDPYLNVDPGTMSPFEHGEVFVLEDGSETDLDLGHYERFLGVNLTKNSSVSAGKIYSEILDKERNGDFLGKSVQVIPNVTNSIQNKITAGMELLPENHIRIIEIGGLSGDIEAEVFMESLRHFKQKHKKDVLHFHLGYVPFLKCSGEYKSKPFQTSLRELLRSGLQPDSLVARYHIEGNQELGENILSKLALFGNVSRDKVIDLADTNSIYKVPKILLEKGVLSILNDFLSKDLNVELPSLVEKIDQPKDSQITIAIVGKYSKLEDAYLSIIESLKLASFANNVKVNVKLVDSEEIESDGPIAHLSNINAVIVAGGFGNRGIEGKIIAINYTREHKIPFLGICLGMQLAVVESLRSIGVKANSGEFSNDGELVINFMKGQSHSGKKGGTMRLGAYPCVLENNTLAKELYESDIVIERHRHRLEVQNQYLDLIKKSGLAISGKYLYKEDEDEKFLVEIIEKSKSEHPFFIATQSHPEFLSNMNKIHPLFNGLVKACVK